jgi:glucosylceramidase
MFRKISALLIVPALLVSLLAFQFGAATAAGETVSVWVTTPDQSKLLAQQANINFGSNSGSNPLTIKVNPNIKYQTMDGWGASFTDSSAWLVYNSPQRNQIMNDLFNTTTGIGLSMLRQPIGASDFSRSGNYNFDNTCCDLSDFSISHDEAYIIPIVKQALQLNPSIKTIMSTWSAPGWMKTSGSMIGGSLNHAVYSDAFASYLVKTVQAFQAVGVPVYALTVQNEPLFIPGGYPGMGMPAADQAGFIGYNLGPALRNAGLNTKIMAYDHNWDRQDYPTTVFSNAAAAQYVAGVAWHCYGGDVSAQQTIHNNFPNMDTWLTECSGGNWWPYFNDFGANLKGFTRNHIILNARYWGKSGILWNMALDANNGPINGGCDTCRGVVTVTGGGYTKTVDYYVLGHASKFVRSGAHRIDSNTFGANSIENVAFQNPDGSLVVVALNDSASAQTFKVVWNGQAFSYTLPGGAVATFKWTPGTTPTFQPPTNTPAPQPTATNTPTSGCSAPAYNNSAVYVSGNQVSYNGRLWQAKWWTQGEAPSTGGSGVWQDLGPCGGGNPTATPTSVGLPDLTISSITYAPSIVPCQNRPGTNVTVANTGNSGAGTFVVRLNGSDKTVSSLAAGQSTTLRWDIAPGNVTATADATNVIAESNESNNSRNATLPIPTPAPACTNTPPPSGNIDPTVWYQVINQNSNKCVDNTDGSTSNGNKIQQWACFAGSINQGWQFRPTSDGYYQIVARRAPTLAWDITDVTNADDALIQLWTYGGGNNQQWRAEAVGGGFYRFVSRHSGKCLDVPRSSTADGVKLVQYTCNGTGAQAFRLAAQ